MCRCFIVVSNPYALLLPLPELAFLPSIFCQDEHSPSNSCMVWGVSLKLKIHVLFLLIRCWVLYSSSILWLLFIEVMTCGICNLQGNKWIYVIVGNGMLSHLLWFIFNEFYILLFFYVIVGLLSHLCMHIKILKNVCCHLTLARRWSLQHLCP
jgi:hypothetical protein